MIAYLLSVGDSGLLILSPKLTELCIDSLLSKPLIVELGVAMGVFFLKGDNGCSTSKFSAWKSNFYNMLNCRWLLSFLARGVTTLDSLCIEHSAVTSFLVLAVFSS